MFRSEWIKSAAIFVIALSFAQCKDDPAGVEIIIGDVEAAIDASTISALEGQTFTFPGGGGAIAPGLQDQTVSLTFTNTSSATPTATLEFPGGSGTFSVSFGSCIFTATEQIGRLSPPPVIIYFSPGDQVTIDPCEISVDANGQPTGQNVSVGVSVSLGGTNSNPLPIPIQISADGTVSIGDVPIGTGATGTTGSG